MFLPNMFNHSIETDLDQLVLLPQALQPAPPTRGILVVDDEANIRRMLKVALENRGFAVWLASTGQEAVNVYRRHCAFIAVVLLDVCMPGLDGPHTLDALKSVNPQLHCCFMTDHSREYGPRDLLARGARHVISKPFYLQEIIRVVRHLAVERMREREEI